jgi:thiamine pyrophosphokinase
VPAAIVFAAAPLQPTDRLRARLARLHQPFVVAADDGATTALAFGLTPDVVIGDLDSLSVDTSVRLEQAGLPIERFPRDKDATDGQLAIDRALAEHPTELVLLGFLGGPRLDQALANVLLLLRLDVPTVLLDERNECTLMRAGATHAWRPEPHEVVSLLPLSADVTGVRTRGLRWRLEGEPLGLGDTRGVSNEPVDAEVSVSLETGLLLLARHFPSPDPAL